MSMTPSRPLNFMAQIGVLGKGECKASLRCPPHVTISFPAVFYNQWSSGGDSSGGASVLEDGPSPYVGLIDIESGIKPPKTGKRDKRNATLKPDSHRDGGRTDSSFTTGQINEVPAPRLNMQSKEKRKRRSLSPKAPPGGSYRIPQQGQLQIVLKNPNKTAVKLFLVPYDLRGMESGTKTFIRQRSYSYGPVIDMPQRLPPAFANNGADRPMLRYLIHLHICCPSKGRYFLYKSIRVVFANRVPDGNEKLQNEIQYPEPRFSVYKPCREYGDVMHSIHASASGSPRRRATGAIDSTHMDVDDGFDDRRSAVPPGSNPASNISPRSFLPVFTPPIFYPSASRLDRGGDMQVDDAFISPTSTAPALFGPPTKSASQTFSSSYKKEPEDLHSHHASESCMSGDYNKLSKGDVGYGGIPYSCQTHGFPCRDSSGAGSAGNGAGDELSSLLARHLKGLEMRKSEDAGRADPSEDF
ncbi:MAG: hypothetical protein M1819_004670 [Sarea resinae]|nr:MAG: hypothetical protein M1819_004670 [Sarea resinae]